MWIFDKLFNRKIEGKSSLDDLAENVVVNKETNTTEIGGNLDVGGNITNNGQPIGSGTKLYKHILFSSNIGYRFTLITTNPQPVDFTNINTYEKLYNYLLNENVLQFINEYICEISYDYESKAFYSTQFQMVSDTKVFIPLLYDDWPLLETTDTVTPL